MLIDLNMNPSPQGGFIVAQDRSFLKPRRSGKSGTSQIVSFEHAAASAARAASLCAGHAQQLGGESPLADLMEVRPSDDARATAARRGLKEAWNKRVSR